MNLYQFLFLPLVFGLIAFVEPCSLGINIMFLNAVQKTTAAIRWKETLTFMFVRASILASLGYSAALVGNRLFQFQTGYFLVMGGIFTLIGLVMITSKKKLLRLKTLRPAHWLGLEKQPGSVARLGIIAGVTIPACAIPFITILLGQSTFSGKAAWGFLSLFIFGIALTLPLIGLSLSQRSLDYLGKLTTKTERIRLINGLVFIALGILTMLSSYYWNLAVMS